MTLRLRGRDPETPAEHLQCMPDRVPIERVFPTDVDLRHERDEVAHGGDLRLLVGGNELEHAHDLRDGGQRGKGALLHLQLSQRIRGGERGEPGPARLHDLPLPDDRLRASRLEIEPVVVEADGRQRERCADGQRRRHDEDGQPMAQQPPPPRRVVPADRRSGGNHRQPMPTRSDMNITEKTLRCPTVAVTTPRDQARLTRSTASIKIGSMVRRITTKSRPTVTTSASSVAIVLSWNALSISSFDRAGVPVAPAATSGYVSRRLRMVWRIAAMKSF